MTAWETEDVTEDVTVNVDANDEINDVVNDVVKDVVKFSKSEEKVYEIIKINASTTIFEIVEMVSKRKLR